MVLLMRKLCCPAHTLLLVLTALVLLAWSPVARADKEGPDDIYKPPDEPWGHCQGDCSSGEEETPDLRLYKDNSYWASYADYKKQRLTVAYHVKNFGPGTLYKVRFVKSRASNEVKSKTHMPIKLGCCLDVGDTAEFRVIYKVPAGVAGFDTYNYAMAKNSCHRPRFYDRSHSVPIRHLTLFHFVYAQCRLARCRW